MDTCLAETSGEPKDPKKWRLWFSLTEFINPGALLVWNWGVPMPKVIIKDEVALLAGWRAE